jgi:hypothetical protein
VENNARASESAFVFVARITHRTDDATQRAQNNASPAQSRRGGCKLIM